MIVLDCNAALSMIMETPEGEALSGLVLSDEKIVAPMLFYAEITHTLLKYVKGGQISRNDMLEKSRYAISLVDDFYSDAELYGEVMSESARLGHSSYDMFYFVLARRSASTLFTMDKKLAELCMQEGVECVHKVTL